MHNNKLHLPKKSMYKVFRIVSKRFVEGSVLLCLSDGLYFFVRLTEPSKRAIKFDAHFRLVLKTDFRLVATHYGVQVSELAYDDIFMPHQVVFTDDRKTVKCSVSSELPSMARTPRRAATLQGHGVRCVGSGFTQVDAGAKTVFDRRF